MWNIIVLKNKFLHNCYSDRSDVKALHSEKTLLYTADKIVPLSDQKWRLQIEWHNRLNFQFTAIKVIKSGWDEVTIFHA
jgi:hypothetical protein